MINILPATSYLIDKKHVQIHTEDYRLAVLCMKYLPFDCFDPDASDEDMRTCLTIGGFAFQDYSVLHWVDHLETLIPFLGKNATEPYTLLGPAVNEFYDTYGAGDLRADDIPTELKERCSTMKGVDYAENLLLLLTHARKSREADEQLSGLRDLGELSEEVETFWRI